MKNPGIEVLRHKSLFSLLVEDQLLTNITTIPSSDKFTQLWSRKNMSSERNRRHGNLPPFPRV